MKRLMLAFAVTTIIDDWLKNGSERLVHCAFGFYCRKPAHLNLNALRRYIAMGITLEDLKIRVKCSKYGKRGTNITVFY